MIFAQELYLLIHKAAQQHNNTNIPHSAFALQATSADFQGTHTIVLFPLLRFFNQPIHQLGKLLGDFCIQQSSWIQSYQVVGGFLNLTLSDAAWYTHLANHTHTAQKLPKTKKIIIEIACPNTNKPLHLGHLRNTFIGDAVANILSTVGHQVYKLTHVNDRGIHICKSMYAYQQDPQAPTPTQKGRKGDHFVGDYYVRFDQQYRQEVATLTQKLGDQEQAKKKAPCMLGVQQMLQAWEQGKPTIRTLWQTMNHWVYQGFEKTYQQLNITFDKSYYESETYLLGKKIVQEGLQKGVFYQKKDRSIWVDLTDESLGHKLLLRSDGTSVYITQDLGTADLRYQDFHADSSIYVVGDEQAHHFAVLFAILKKLHRPYATHLSHLAYGMIDLPSGKMKSREGTVVDADSIIAHMTHIAEQQTQHLGKTSHFTPQERQHLHQTLAVGALKFFLLKVSPQKRMCFDPQKSIDFLGYTAAFIQYSYARITTMLAKVKNTHYKQPIQQPSPLQPAERQLIAQLLQLTDIIHEAAHTLNPAICANHLYELAKAYNQLYTQLPILRATNPIIQHKRLHLSFCTQQQLHYLATLLSIQLPERM